MRFFFVFVIINNFGLYSFIYLNHISYLGNKIAITWSFKAPCVRWWALLIAQKFIFVDCYFFSHFSVLIMFLMMQLLWEWFQILTEVQKSTVKQSPDLVQILYLGSSRKYLEPSLLFFPLPLKLRVVHIRKKLKITNFSKMAPTILIKFCGFIVAYIRSPTIWHYRLFPEKFLNLEK